MFHPPFAPSQRKDLGQYEKFKLAGKQLINEFVDKFPEPYLIRTDVQTFYPTVNHVQLINLLRDNQWLTDERLLKLLENCLDQWQILSPYQCGIPIGYDTSDLLGNLYLISLDKLLIENECRAIRYVDDVYIFTKNYENAKEALFYFDNHLNKLHLTRNASKTLLCALSEKDKDRLLKELDLNNFLSDIDENNIKQIDNYLQKNEDCDPSPCKQPFLSNPQRLAYILYRSELKDDKLKDSAFDIINYHPRYVFHATYYLSRHYKDDKVVINRIKEFANSPYEQSEVRFNCISALKLMVGFSEIKTLILNYLISEDDWYLRYKLLDLLPKTPNNVLLSFLIQFLKDESNQHIKAKTIIFIFRHQSLNYETKVELIQSTLDDKEHLFIQRLGIFLWQLNKDIISRNDLRFSTISENIRKIFDFDKDINQLKENFGKIIKIPITDELTDILFSNLQSANQLLLNIGMFSKPPAALKEYVKYVHDFCFLVLKNLVSKNIKINNIEDIYNNLRHDIKIKFGDRINSLLFYFNNEDLFIRETAIIGDDKGINNRYRIKEIFENICKITIEYVIDEKGLAPMREEVFISYAREDNFWLEQIKKYVFPKVLKITPWTDAEIKYGDKWRAKINEALSRAKMVIFIISGDFVQSEFILKHELPYVLDNDDNIIIVLILASDCRYDRLDERIMEFNWVNMDEPLDKLLDDKNRNRELISKLTEISKEIEKML